MKEKKPCKKCPKPRYANITLCYSHHLEKARIKRTEQIERAKVRKKSTKKFQKSERKRMHRKCWKLMSVKVRQNGMDPWGYNQCFTCNKRLHWQEFHAGHFQHGKLDFDDRNLRPQCAACNTYGNGKLDAYTLRLIKENSVEWVDQLRADAFQHLGYKLEELEVIYKELSKGE